MTHCCAQDVEDNKRAYLTQSQDAGKTAVLCRVTSQCCVQDADEEKTAFPTQVQDAGAHSGHRVLIFAQMLKFVDIIEKDLFQ